MDVKIIESLIEAFTNAGLTKFSLKCKEFELKLCKDDVVTTIMQPTVTSTPVLDTTDITPADKPMMPPDGPGQDSMPSQNP